MQKKLERFAAVINQQQLERYKNQGFTYDFSKDCEVHIRPGEKYVKVDVGSSGKFMVDENENIFGIKGYGVIHRGKQYGTLDTIDEYFWGEYRPIKKPIN